MLELKYRKCAVSRITKEPGCYALLDLDKIPLYVGQSSDGIQARVRRHLTSARSDIIANRQIDLWEIAYVWSFPTPKENLENLEAFLFHHFNDQSPLINGKVPRRPQIWVHQAPEPSQEIQVLPDASIKARLDPTSRFPRQAQQYCLLLDYFLNVKRSDDVARALQAHFCRFNEGHKTICSVMPLFSIDGDGDE